MSQSVKSVKGDRKSNLQELELPMAVGVREKNLESSFTAAIVNIVTECESKVTIGVNSEVSNVNDQVKHKIDGPKGAKSYNCNLIDSSESHNTLDEKTVKCSQSGVKKVKNSGQLDKNLVVGSTTISKVVKSLSGMKMDEYVKVDKNAKC